MFKNMKITQVLLVAFLSVFLGNHCNVKAEDSLYITAEGKIGLRTNSPANDIDINGNVTFRNLLQLTPQSSVDENAPVGTLMLTTEQKLFIKVTEGWSELQLGNPQSSPINGTPVSATDLPITAQLVLHLDASKTSSLTLLTGGVITEWKDLSGQDNHAHPVLNEEPTLVTAAMAGRDAVYFDGDAMTFNNFTLSAEDQATIIVVFKADNTDQNQGGLIYKSATETTNGWGMYFGNAPSNLFHTVNTSSQNSTDFSDEFPFLGTTKITSLILNGDALSSQNAYGVIKTFTKSGAMNNSSAPLLIGKRSGDGNHMKGYVYEVIVYNRPISNIERDAIFTHLSAKWGLLPPNPVSSGLFLHYDAADENTITVVNGKVTQLADKAVSQNHAVQTNETRQPIIVKDSNALQMMRFDSDDYLSLPSINHAASDYTMFIVYQPQNIYTQGEYLFDSDSGGAERLVLAHQFNPGWSGLAFGAQVNTKADSGLQLLTYRLDSSATNRLRMYRNKFTTTTGTFIQRPLGGNTTLFTSKYFTNFAGDLGEFIIFDRVLSDQEIADMQDHLMNKWAISGINKVMDAHFDDPQLDHWNNYQTLTGVSYVPDDGGDSVGCILINTSSSLAEQRYATPGQFVEYQISLNYKHLAGSESMPGKVLLQWNHPNNSIIETMSFDLPNNPSWSSIEFTGIIAPNYSKYLSLILVGHENSPIQIDDVVFKEKENSNYSGSHAHLTA